MDLECQEKILNLQAKLDFLRQNQKFPNKACKGPVGPNSRK